MNVATAPFAFTSTATRHALDVVTFGGTSERYNARDKYRNQYTGAERAGAGFGAAAGTAIPGLALAKWLKDGRQVPQALENAPRWGKAGAAIVAGGAGVAMMGVGASKLAQIVSDDGNLGAVGTSAGIVGGTALGSFAGAKLGSGWKAKAFGGLAGMVAGGVAAGMGARHITIGESKIGQPHDQAPNVDANAAERGASFAQGAWNHFVEFGPISQGEGNAQAWGMRDTFHDKYSNSERNGALNGDLFGAAAMSAGAAGMAAAGFGVASKQIVLKDGRVLSPVASAADRAGRITSVGAVNAAARRTLEMIPGRGAGRIAGIAMATGAIGTAFVAQREANAWSDEHHHTGGGLAALGVIGATSGLALGLARSEAFKAAPKWNRVGGAMVAASGIIGVLSAARIGVAAFHNDAKDAEKIAPADRTTRNVMGGGLGVLGAGAALAASSKAIPKGGIDLAIPLLIKTLNVHVPRPLGVGLATAGAGALGYMVGTGVSPTLPSLPTVGIAAGAGAAVAGVGALGLRGLTKSPKVMGLAVAGGAVAGAMTSAVWKRDEPRAAEPVAVSPH
jgi:hypothetical protein